jgi:hypothetical protein
MSNPFQIQFTLRQHTPLIHFQHDQDGATLRATEVKPKLDRFILNDLNQIRPDLFEAVKHCFVERDGKVWGDYKITMKTEGDSEKYIVTNMVTRRDRENLAGQNLLEGTAYFADAQHISKNQLKLARRGVLFPFDSTKIKISFFSYHIKLIESIESICEYFFAFTSFGTRQNKGFGCFYPETVSEKRLEEIYSRLPKAFESVYYFESRTPLQQIQSDYQLLKAGKNFNGYEKSLLWEYFSETNPAFRWEKRFFKVKMKNDYPNVFGRLKYRGTKNRIADISKPTDKTEHRYIRIVLGMAEHFEFMKERGKHIKIKVEDAAVDAPKSTNADVVERFASPLLFKVFNSKIYVLVQTIPSLLFRQHHRNEKGELMETRNANNQAMLRAYKFKLSDNEEPSDYDLGKLNSIGTTSITKILDYTLNNPYNNTNKGKKISQVLNWIKLT